MNRVLTIRMGQILNELYSLRHDLTETQEKLEKLAKEEDRRFDKLLKPEYSLDEKDNITIKQSPRRKNGKSKK